MRRREGLGRLAFNSDLVRSVYEVQPTEQPRGGWTPACGSVSAAATPMAWRPTAACGLILDPPGGCSREPSRRDTWRFALQPIGFVSRDLTRSRFCRTLIL